MSDIYWKACEVRIWFGNASDVESSPLPALEEIAALVDIPRDAASRSLSELLSEPSKARGWNALGSLSYSQWWYRYWIIQEITFAKKAIMIYSQCKMQWEQLSKLNQIWELIWSVCQQSTGSLAYAGPAATFLDNTQLSVIEMLRRSYPFDVDSLASLLLPTRSYKATDARDKIYAFLNPLTERNTYIDIDYDLTTCEIYMQITRHFGQSSRKLDFRSWVQHGNALSSYHLPSWTPDWSTALSNNIRLLTPGRHSDPEMWSTLYEATFNSEAQAFLILKP